MMKLKRLTVCYGAILNLSWFGNAFNVTIGNGEVSFVERIISEADEFIMLMVLALILCFLVFLYFKGVNRQQRREYENIISNQKLEYLHVYESKNSETALKDDLPKRKMVITDDTTRVLLDKLLEFERSQMYIDQKMSLSTLSSMLNTNSKYLSEIIKNHKNKNFKNYINGLRIDYIMNLLFNEPEYREYKISYLAGCCGFSSRVVFGVVFKKEKGISPSYFIQSLGKSERTIADSLS